MIPAADEAAASINMKTGPAAYDSLIRLSALAIFFWMRGAIISKRTVGLCESSSLPQRK